MLKSLNEVFEAIAQEVTFACAKRHVSGFFFMADLSEGEARFRRINFSNPLRIGVSDKKDCNFAAVAGSKLGMVIAHRCDTGGETHIIGEVPYKGGHIGAEDRFAYCFSGAPEDVDLELMKLAEEYHRKLSSSDAVVQTQT